MPAITARARFVRGTSSLADLLVPKAHASETRPVTGGAANPATGDSDAKTICVPREPVYRASDQPYSRTTAYSPTFRYIAIAIGRGSRRSIFQASVSAGCRSASALHHGP